MKVEQLFACHHISEERKVPLATLSIQGYALYWWTSLVRERRIYGCQTQISSGDYHSWIFGFSLAELSCSTPVTVQDERSFDVLVKGAKDTKRDGQKGLFRDFSRPQLAQASLWLTWAPPNGLGLKSPTRPGKPSHFRVKHQLNTHLSRVRAEVPNALTTSFVLVS